MYDEIIPDSEPEREEERRQLEEERRKKRTRKRVSPGSTRTMSFVLSSSPEPDLRLPPPLRMKSPPKLPDTRSVITISDGSSSEAEMFAPKFTNSNATEATHPKPGPSRLPQPRKQPTPASTTDSSERTSGAQSLSSSDLSRFSYIPSQSLRDMIKERDKRKAREIAQFGPPEPLRKSKVAKPAAHSFTADFTDDELSRVLRCVSCGDRWTVRKGAKAKMRHIQSCARKNALTDDMIKRLILAELEAPEEPEPRKKPKSSRVTNTLLEDALGDAGNPTKKRKQVQRTTTLHNPADNREAILAKARSLLKEPEIRDLSQDQEALDTLKNSNSTMDQIDMFDLGRPPTTQQFGRSKLGKQTSSAMLSVLSDTSPKMSTTSKLADATNHGRHFDLFTGEEIDSGSPISVNSSIDAAFERLSLHPLGFQDGDAESDHGTEVSWYNDSAVLHYNQSENDLDWGNNYSTDDGAILHFDPVERNQPISRSPPLPSETFAPVCTPSTTSNPVPPMPKDRPEQTKGRKATKPRSRKKKTDVQSDDPTQPTDVDDTVFRSKMLDAIREHDEFYHKILRYEPIPLDDFVDLAAALDFSGRWLRTRVTRFLDEQAIHFQAPTNGGRR